MKWAMARLHEYFALHDNLLGVVHYEIRGSDCVIAEYDQFVPTTEDTWFGE
jgi:hypothetical protein